MTAGDLHTFDGDGPFTKRFGRGELLKRGAVLGASVGLAPLLRATDALGAVDAGKTLTVWYLSQSPAEIKLVKSLLDGYGKQHGVKVAFTPYGFDAENKALALALSAHTGPDLAYASPGVSFVGKWAADGYVTNLTSIGKQRGWSGHFQPSVLNFYNPGGKIFGYPYDISAVGNYYNAKIFLANGIRRPSTFAEYEAALAKLKAAGITPFAVGGKDGWPLWQIMDQFIHGDMPFSYMTKLYYQKKSASWNVPSVIRAAETLQSWGEKGYFNDGFLGISASDANNLFLNQKTAMALTGSWNNALFASQAKFPVRFFRTPAMKPSMPYHMGGFTPNNLWIVPKFSKQPDLALEFMGFALGQKVATALWNSGDIPAYVFKQTPKAKAALQADVYNAMKKSLTGYYNDNGQVGQAMYAAAQALAAGKTSPKSAVAQIESVYKSVAT